MPWHTRDDSWHGFWEKAAQSKTAMGTVHHKQASDQQAGGRDPKVLQDGASLLKLPKMSFLEVLKHWLNCR